MCEQLVLRYFTMIILGLEHAHTLLVEHRYLESFCVYVSKDRSVVYLGDFGNEPWIRGVRSAGNHCVTIGHFSENSDDNEYGSKKDIYRAGLILLEMLLLSGSTYRDEAPSARVKKIPGYYSDVVRNLCRDVLPVNQCETPSAREVLEMEGVKDLVPGLVNTPYFHKKYADLLKERITYGWAHKLEVD